MDDALRIPAAKEGHRRALDTEQCASGAHMLLRYHDAAGRPERLGQSVSRTRKYLVHWIQGAEDKGGTYGQAWAHGSLLLYVAQVCP